MNRVWKGLGWTVVVVALLGGTVKSASAQMHPWTDRGFVNVNFGFQTKARTAIAEDRQPLYDEEATGRARISVGNAPVVDVAGGWRLWRNLAVGVAFSRYSDSSDGTLSVSIPDPLIFDMPHQAGLIVPGLEQTEFATHLSAVWVMPITDKIDIAISAGPSFFSVSKDVITGLTIAPGGTTVTNVATGNVSKNGVGGHIAFDAQYVLLEDAGPFRTVGAGLFVRYGTAKLDFDELLDQLEVGGLNYGIGARLRF